ncbi:hypothetical protein DN402_24595 [Streptomyces sp. SW4]|nr:hypothetical protein DN402_24595 [Streptomyces sp. SW4]
MVLPFGEILALGVGQRDAFAQCLRFRKQGRQAVGADGVLLFPHLVDQTTAALEKRRGTVGLLHAHPRPHLRDDRLVPVLGCGRQLRSVEGTGHAVDLFRPVDVEHALSLPELLDERVELFSGHLLGRLVYRCFGRLRRGRRLGGDRR